MPSSGGPGQACVWLISCLLFLLLLTGGVFLALYISLPSSAEHAWFLPAGMGLVAAPWIFWILTCLYRCIVLQIKHSIGSGQDGSPPPPQQQVVRQSTAVARAAPLTPVIEEGPESPDGAARKVRFGNVMVANGANGNKNGGDEEMSMSPRRSGGGANRRDGGGSSNTSRESEQPLALSMS
ncbi:hypothetical protein LUZ60_007709 [Juncus effusus]|nr:hypothetical protein LUZ60_007709 [Juncus effusus]